MQIITKVVSCAFVIRWAKNKWLFYTYIHTKIQDPFFLLVQQFKMMTFFFFEEPKPQKFYFQIHICNDFDFDGDLIQHIYSMENLYQTELFIIYPKFNRISKRIISILCKRSFYVCLQRQHSRFNKLQYGGGRIKKKQKRRM